MLKYIIGIIPLIIIVILYLIFDKNKNIKKNILLIILFIIGCIGSYICYRIEIHIGGYFPKIKTYGYIASIFYALFGVAIFEEGYKWFFTNSFIFKRKLSKIEIMEYAIFISLGFAIFESLVFYISKYGMDVAISRLYSAIPLHIGCAIFMGYLLGLDNHKIRYNILGLIIPTCMHAFYNSFLYMKNDNLNIYSFLFLIIIFLYILYKYVKIRLIKE